MKRNFDKDFEKYLNIDGYYRKFIENFNRQFQTTLRVSDVFNMLPPEFQQGIYLAFFRENRIHIDTYGHFACEIWTGIKGNYVSNTITNNNYNDCLTQAIEKAKRIYEEEK